MAIDTSSLQFESGETMRRAWETTARWRACRRWLGKQMQFFSGRARTRQVLALRLNGGHDER